MSTPTETANPTRDELGRLVRDEWVAFAKQQPNPKSGHLVGWDDLDEQNREVDRRIGVRLYNEGRAALATLQAGNAELRAELESHANQEVSWKMQTDALRERLEAAERERDRLSKLVNSPEIVDFAKAVILESAHQRERWGAEGDAGKRDADWFWLVGYLAGKALWNPGDGVDVADEQKQLHRIITVAAACCNWHAAKLKLTDMRPGILPPPGESI